MATRKNNDPQKETALEVTLALGLVFVVLAALVWFLSSHKIIYYSAPLLRWLGAPWALLAPGKWTALNEGYVFFRTSPGQVPAGNFFAYANDCLRPLAMLVCLGSAGYLFRRLTSKSGSADLRRRLEPMQAAKEIAKTFPAIMPVLHLGPDLVANKLPLWRRQTFPEDVWTNEKISGKPLAAGGRFYRERVEIYFRGGEVKDGAHQLRGGRRWSKMLGFLAVDLIADVPKQASICFPDRFSAQGKVLFALLCAHAFGGREGKLDYQKACDQLNRSCAGQANGLPNLTVAQWLYTKYRMHESARKLFTVHHWEFTYLFSLFLKAKISGKATHTDFIWLKPLDRVLFYSLNTVGRAVPHAEAGAVFAVYDYETKCARYNRLPLRMRKDGTLEANICIFTAVDALSQEFDRYQAATDEDENWWMNLQTWSAAQRMAAEQEGLKQSMAEFNASQQKIASLPAQPHSDFDVQANAERNAHDQARNVAAIRAMGGSNAGTGATTGGGLDMF